MSPWVGTREEALRIAYDEAREDVVFSDKHFDVIVRHPRPKGSLVLMNPLSDVARLPADARIAGQQQRFDLPVWRDSDGNLRIGLPKTNPEHSGDMDQLVVSVSDILTAIGRELGR